MEEGTAVINGSHLNATIFIVNTQFSPHGNVNNVLHLNECKAQQYQTLYQVIQFVH